MLLYPNAKINIGLNILNKRLDGYHNISSVFLPVGISDIIEFTVAKENEDKFIQTGLEVEGLSENNLCVKVYNYLKIKYKIPFLQIHLHKQIPTQAGLGGGSADAAFLIKGINDYFNLQLSDEQLKDLAFQFGSDCPFFIDNKISIIQGRGEIITPIQFDFSEYHIIIVKPHISISTADAYSTVSPCDINPDWNNLLRQEISSWKNTIVNDFEPIATNKFPKLANIKKILYNNGALFVQMSGSGSAFYGIFQERKSHINSLFKNTYVYWTKAN